MCAIAGILDLVDRRPVLPEAIRAMAGVLTHRGPDEGGFYERPGLALASRRLSIVGLADGRQPVTNEDRSVFAVFNGELFDYPELRAEVEGRGHRFATHCDTELLPHLWEEHGEAMFERLRGQFALALWDQRRRRLVLARDRFGICPLFWARQDGWLVFASEAKALFASGLVRARPDPRGLDQVFTFFALPGPVTCFAGVSALLPGHYLDVRPPDASARPAAVRDVAYWEVNFPDRGAEDPGHDSRRVVDGFEAVLTRAVERRLRADVPVVSYLSGGVDSSIVVALARRLRGESIPTFTVRVDAPGLDESAAAVAVARHVGGDPVVTNCGPGEVVGAYRELIEAAECPVIDTACAALLLQARAVHALGYKVALTGEGSDEWLAGYPWYKVNRLLGWLDAVPGLPLARLGRRAYAALAGPPGFGWQEFVRFERGFGGPHAFTDLYGLTSMAKYRLFSRRTRDLLAGYQPYDDLALNRDGMRRWHPLNRALYVGARIMLPGLLLSCKGDRVAMHSSVETRYPFLDEEVFTYLSGLYPRWKLRGLRDKYVLRRVAERWLPPAVAWRRKAMFRAPFESLFALRPPTFVDQLLSAESLRRTGYFDVDAVGHWRRAVGTGPVPVGQRLFLQMGLAGVVATQLWHHLFIDGSLADLPSAAPLGRPVLAAAS